MTHEDGSVQWPARARTELMGRADGLGALVVCARDLWASVEVGGMLRSSTESV